MAKNFDDLISSLESNSVGKSKKAKSAKHYLDQIRSIDRFYILLMSVVEYISNACNVRSLEHSSKEHVEYFKSKNTRSRGIRLVYDIQFDFKFGSPIFAYTFERAYKNILMNENMFECHSRLNDRMDMCKAIFKSIKEEASLIPDSFNLENIEVFSVYDFDDNDIQVSFVKCNLSIKIELNKLNV